VNDVAGPPLPAADDPRSRFYQGTILRLHAGSRTGVVRTGNGRDVMFTIADVRLLGTDGGFAALREGMQVGFDLGWTSRGVRVTTIRLFD
jgi:cold shock CspA family protein